MSHADEYRKIFEHHGHLNGKSISDAVRKTKSAGQYTHNTVYTGINKMINSHGTPPEGLVEGLREALGYDPQLDRLLRRHYGIEPAPVETAAKPPASSTPKVAQSKEAYETIFRRHGYEVRAELGRAVNRTEACKHLGIEGIQTGLREMVLGKRKPTSTILQGLREALHYDPELDRLLSKQYGVKLDPAPRQEAPAVRIVPGPDTAARQESSSGRPAPAGPYSTADAQEPRPRGAASRLEQLLGEIGPAYDAAFDEIHGKLRSAYENAKPPIKHKLYRGLTKLYQDMGLE